MYQVVETFMRTVNTKNAMLLRDGMPLYYPNLFITEEKASRALNTRKGILEHLKLLHEIFDHLGIDLVDRLEQRPAHYLTDSEIASIVADLSLKKSTLDLLYRGVKVLDSAYEWIGEGAGGQRKDAVMEYLGYLYETLGDDSRDEAAARVKDKIMRKTQIASKKWTRGNDEYKGLTDLQRELLLRVTHPDSDENPFVDKATRLRNRIIILLGLECGLRKGEMQLVKVRDYDYTKEIKKDDGTTHRGVLNVVDVDDHSIDTRKRAPQFKTRERAIAIQSELQRSITRYIDNYRPRRLKHPFLLVSHRGVVGQPLNRTGVDKVFNKLRETFPELSDMTPHVLRHDAVYTLLKSMKSFLDKQTAHDRDLYIQRVLTYQFGWAPDSEMPGLYGQKFWREEANAAMIKRHERLEAALKANQSDTQESES